MYTLVHVPTSLSWIIFIHKTCKSLNNYINFRLCGIPLAITVRIILLYFSVVHLNYWLCLFLLSLSQGYGLPALTMLWCQHLSTDEWKVWLSITKYRVARDLLIYTVYIILLARPSHTKGEGLGTSVYILVAGPVERAEYKILLHCKLMHDLYIISHVLYTYI